jgi:excisionase family DNA binding protein
MNIASAENDEPRLTYTVEETSGLLGLSVHSTYEAIRRSEIPAIRIGRRILIPRAALDATLLRTA